MWKHGLESSESFFSRKAINSLFSFSTRCPDELQGVSQVICFRYNKNIVNWGMMCFSHVLEIIQVDPIPSWVPSNKGGTNAVCGG